MKPILTIILSFLLSASLAQKKDSVVAMVPDSVNTISVNDVNKVLKYLEDKITVKDYMAAMDYFKILVLITDTKRKQVVKQK